MIAFRAHRKGPGQDGFTAGQYSQVLFPCVIPDPAYIAPGYDIGTRFASSLWTPVAIGEPSAKVVFNGQLWVNGGLGIAAGENFVGRIIKTGSVSIGAKIGSKGAFVGDWIIDLAMQDIAQPGEAYGVYFYTNNPNVYIDGNSLHTFWSGMVIP